MLTKFVVENFKNFRERLEWNLADYNNYEFNSEVVEDGAINKALVFGQNGSGKSNLGLALFDIVHHLTDKEKMENKYIPYLNLETENLYAYFEYHFLFYGQELVYTYRKSSSRKLLEEHLSINGIERVAFNYQENTGFSILAGTETLNLNGSSDISRVKYIKSNAILQDSPANQIFNCFTDFVDSMLLFYSLDKRGYQGFCNGSESISKGIIESGRLAEFEEFLHTQEIDYRLVAREIDGQPQIYCVFEHGETNFFSVASTGTVSLALFFYWYIRMEEASLVFIDEFDAFYHFALAKDIVERLKRLRSTQIFLTSHNTDLISNDLLRPDCYFYLQRGQIRAISDLTDKEIRKAHNLQKMYKAGVFDEI